MLRVPLAKRWSIKKQERSTLPGARGVRDQPSIEERKVESENQERLLKMGKDEKQLTPNGYFNFSN